MDYILPEDIHLYLEDYGITHLSDARNWGSGSHDYWLSTVDLDLGGPWKDLWTQYIIGLQHGGICISDGLDWSGCTTSAMV